MQSVEGDEAELWGHEVEPAVAELELTLEGFP